MTVTIPDAGASEAAYAAEVLLRGYLGIDFACAQARTDRIRIEAEGRAVEFPACFFLRAERAWLLPEMMPERPVRWWTHRDGAEEDRHAERITVPVLFGDPYCAFSERSMRCGIDLFGSAFFMLSRFEEAVNRVRDAHDRFPAAASIAVQEGFLERPVVNEYAELAWSLMKRVWPRLGRRQRECRRFVTCDVDLPRLSPVMAAIASRFLLRRFGMFDWMMDVNERAGNEMTFFFRAESGGGSSGRHCGICEPCMRALMRRIHSRGHKIGLHCSYHAYRDERRTADEAATLRRVMEEERIAQDEIGSRQHFLRWDAINTGKILEAAGFTYDSTLSFADRCGFRCGACIGYPMYDLSARRAMTICQRPLVVCERPAGLEGTMSAACSAAEYARMRTLRSECLRHGGEFTLLWHHTSLMTAKEKEMYLNLIE